MTLQRIAWSEDLPLWAVLAIGLVVLLLILRGTVQASRSGPKQRWLGLVDIVVGLVLGAALLRPSWVTTKSTSLGQSVAVLVDGSRRLLVRAGGSTRAEDAARAVERIKDRFSTARLSFFEFGGDSLRPLTEAKERRHGAGGNERAIDQSDLYHAMEQLPEQLGEKPAAVIVVSDGRLSRPAADLDPAALLVPNALRGTRLHTVDVGGKTPLDASIVAVETSGNAVAHQPFTIDIVVGCFGGLNCTRVPVSVREHKRAGETKVLASADADLAGKETARISVELTLERAGTRVIEVAIAASEGDTVPENNVRMLPFQVLRERLRLLHVAGRPTYDVRALRSWLKSDASVDLVSFFILRTDGDDTNVDEDSELALIPFPVDELFDEHLPSFDAVLLGDIDAERYRLTRYLSNLARYVEQGGGLILVGGPSAFSGGSYASTPLDRVLPVTLVNSDRPFDTVEFVPKTTSAGKHAALLTPLRDIWGDTLLPMPGANSFGIARADAVVLWEHPIRRVLPVKTGGTPREMPILAISEAGDGRVVALGVDGTHRLAFGRDAARYGGRAYGALWDGLLGWVIRDPRFESTHAELLGECIADLPATARIDLGQRISGKLVLEMERLDVTRGSKLVRSATVNDQSKLDVDLGALPAGAYSALVRLDDGPATRFDFACESGGRAWADTRPDPQRLRALAAANGGKYVDVSAVGELPVPPQSMVYGSRTSRSILHAWQWSLLASMCLGLNWLLRRANGLA